MDIIYKAMFSIVGVTILSILIHVVIHLIFHSSFYSKPLAKIVGFAVASMGAFIFTTFYNELRDIPTTPEEISIENIAAEMSTRDHLWVSIPDGKWDCNNLAHASTGDTFVVLLNKEETLVIVASFAEKRSCEELDTIQPSGRLAKFVHRGYVYTSNYIDFTKYESATTILSLCAYCGRQNSQLGVAMGIIFTMLGLFYDKVGITGLPRKRNRVTLLPPRRDSTN